MRLPTRKGMMSRAAKLFDSVIANPNAAIPFRDFEYLLRAFGFQHVRTNGSHRVYAHPIVPGLLSIQPRKGEAKSYQVRQFLAICAEYGLTLDE